MTAYYNEFSPHAAAWLRKLIAAGHIASGDVDERSITDVHPDDLRGYTQHHFFAGIGGWSLALRLAGWPDDRPVWTGSCPCQPFSTAGLGAGASDARHLWPTWYHLIAQHQPPVLFGEQVASPLGRAWFSAVRADLEDVGYAVGGADLCAAGVGASHIRQRLYFVADTEWHEQSWQESRGGSFGRMGRVEQPLPWDEPWEAALARFRAMGDGLPRCVAGTDAARNAIVPQVAQVFIEAYLDIRDGVIA